MPQVHPQEEAGPQFLLRCSRSPAEGRVSRTHPAEAHHIEQPPTEVPKPLRAALRAGGKTRASSTSHVHSQWPSPVPERLEASWGCRRVAPQRAEVQQAQALAQGAQMVKAEREVGGLVKRV